MKLLLGIPAGLLMIGVLVFAFLSMRKMSRGVLESEKVRTTLPIKKVGTA